MSECVASVGVMPWCVLYSYWLFVNRLADSGRAHIYCVVILFRPEFPRMLPSARRLHFAGFLVCKLSYYEDGRHITHETCRIVPNYAALLPRRSRSSFAFCLTTAIIAQTMQCRMVRSVVWEPPKWLLFDRRPSQSNGLLNTFPR
jgi:hypothetical protein